MYIASATLSNDKGLAGKPGTARLLIISIVMIISLVNPSTDIFGQRRVEWIYSDYVEYDQQTYGKVRRAIGSVEFRHEGTYLYCDSAYFYELTNRIEAYSNVHVKDSDTLNLFCDFLVYTPETGTAVATKNVVLVDPQVSLTTEELIYDIRNKTAYYDKGGTIVSKTNTLKSVKGFYYADRKHFEFEKNVILEHPKFVMTTDTLHYNTQTEVATIFGPTDITGEENDIYTERGIYNTKIDIAWLWKNSCLTNKDTRLKGDSIVYDRNILFSQAYKNVTIRDTVQQYILGGNFGEYDEITGYSFLTDSAWAVFIDQGDSLSLHADTLHLEFDSLRNGRIFSAYYGAKFYRSDVQGASDSIVYCFSDSVITMYNQPVIWFGKTQVVADTIMMYFEMRKLSRMEMEGGVFIISDDTPDQFNQVKGKRITALFEEDELSKMIVETNTETLYYVRDEQDVLIGIDKAISDRLRMEFNEGEIVLIVYLGKPMGTTWPESELTGDDRKLRGFNLRINERPNSRVEIFHRDLMQGQ